MVTYRLIFSLWRVRKDVIKINLDRVANRPTKQLETAVYALTSSCFTYLQKYTALERSLKIK